MAESPSTRIGTFRPGPGVLLARLAELGKLRLSILVVLTTLVGYLLATPAAPAVPGLLWTLLGTLLAALGANALNEWWEVERDARMTRTRTRPLPTRRLTGPVALGFGLLTAFLGPLILAAQVALLPAMLAATTIAIYVGLYTPLKVRSALSTLVGGIVGALPPLIGWAAAAGTLDPGAWILATILFLWQVPHALALAWLRRSDYAGGGFRLLPAVDPAGHLTGCVVVMYTLVLFPATMALTLVGVCGWRYAIGAATLGIGLTMLAVWLERRRTATAARALFVGTLVYLPLLLVLMVFDR